MQIMQIFVKILLSLFNKAGIIESIPLKGRESTNMNYATIKTCDIANGPGVRTSLFVSGCTHHCKNCFNQEAWDFDYGEPFTPVIQQQVLEECAPSYIAGLSLLGGEPMEPANQRGLLPLLTEFRARFPEKSIWCYSGYTYEQLKTPGTRCYLPGVTEQLLSLIDVLVDGQFVQALYDISLRFRGSSNQRLIDLRKTEAAGEIVWWEDAPVYSSRKM